MYVLFEDDGQCKAGTILADNDTSLQVESVSGRRLKIKAAAALLRFTDPAPPVLLAEAQAQSGDVDPGFLWEVSADDEFAFADLALEYFGRVPTPVESTTIAFALAAAPMYFYKRGKGRYRKAPPDALKAALASVERRKREALRVESWVGELAAHRLPPELVACLPMLLHQPDKNALEWKALTAACAGERTNPVALLAACGAIPSTHEYHFEAFVRQAFPRGTAFPAWGTLPAIPELPLAAVRAFSIDAASTTEIDDAFSVSELPGGRHRIGIHIAAPAVAIPRGSPLDAIARARLSTVYMPGRKITMLPDEVIDAFSLAEGRSPPALSMYAEIDAEGALLAEETRLERVPIAANLRLDAIGEAFTAETIATDAPPWTAELAVLWRFARALHKARGKTDTVRVDYEYDVDWSSGPEGRVRIDRRPRGSPLDRLVSELMIFVNGTWGRRLADAGAAGLYRTQSSGKVRMSTRPAEHQGLGIAHYLWASSPLRRYSDLVNQRQLIAQTAGEKLPYPENDAELHAALADFEATYSLYAEFQERMERYWCLRYLLQEGIEETTATVLRENLIRFDHLPLIMRLPDLPDSPPETSVRVMIGAIDLLAATVECRCAGRTV